MARTTQLDAYTKAKLFGPDFQPKFIANSHNKYCDCFDCQPDYIQQLQAKTMKPYLVQPTGRMDYAEITTKPADYYLDSTLVAKVPVTIYKSPSLTAPVVNKYAKGTNVGKIQSWVVRDGNVWWDIDYFSGVHAGWVKHDPSLFDAAIAEQTASGAAQAAEVKKLTDAAAKPADIGSAVIDGAGNVVQGASNLLSGVGDTLGSIGANLKWYILAIVLVFIILAFLKYAK